jgi:hypothetical protein
MLFSDAIKLAVVAALLVSLIGCSDNADAENAIAMKNSLKAMIPAGTPVAEAESRLKARGFNVSRERDSSWADKQHLDYLYGDMREGAPVQRRWQVAVFYRQNTTTGIEVNTGLVGP